MAFEVKIIEWLQGFSTGVLDTVVAYGSFFFDYSIIVGVFLLFYLNNKKAYGWYFALVECISALIQVTAKKIFLRDRPYVANPSIRGIFLSNGTSFPSGHSLTAMIVFLFLIFFIFTQTRSKRERICWSALGVVYLLLNAFNRMYLGQHYLTDILGGYFLGIAICSVAFLLYKSYVRGYYQLCGNIEKRINNRKDEKKEGFSN